MIDFEKVIREAAIKNKVVLHKDDPALLFASTVNLMLEELNASLAAALDKYQNDHEHIARRWKYDAEVSAAKVLNAALDAGREAAAKTMAEGADKVTKLIAGEMLAAQAQQRMEMSAVVEDIRRHTLHMLMASSAVLGVAVLLLIL